MSVENHRHCQATILSASGIGGSGRTWNEINSLNTPMLEEYKPDWKSLFQNNSNITQDLASILKLIEVNSQKIYEVHEDTYELERRLGSVEEDMSQDTSTGEIIECLIAPNESYFVEQSTIFQKINDEEGRPYYTVRNPADIDKYAAFYTTDKRIYPGNDENINKQYQCILKKEDLKSKARYPLFTLFQAQQLLRRFRSNGATTYKIVTQYGKFYYERNQQIIQLTDASAGSQLIIGPAHSFDTLKKLPCMTEINGVGDTYYTGEDFSDDDFVKSKFIWKDNGHNYNTWNGLLLINGTNVTFQDVGFDIIQETTPLDGKGGQTLIIIPKSGNITFAGCLFKHSGISTNISTGASVNFMATRIRTKDDSSDYKWDANYYKNTKYNVDNLSYWIRPCVFDDSGDERAEILKPFINLNDGDSTEVSMGGSSPGTYMVFRNSRSQVNQILIGSGCNIHFGHSFSAISKIVFNKVADTFLDPSSEIKLLFHKPCSSATISQAAYPQDTPNDSYGKQLRIEIHSSNNIPDTSTYHTSIISNGNIKVKNRYDTKTGVYNTYAGVLNQADNNNAIKLNETFLTRDPYANTE